MRSYQAKRQWSTSGYVLLPFEKAVIDKIDIIQPITVSRKVKNKRYPSDKRVVDMACPFVVDFLKDRYALYEYAIEKDWTMQEYITAVEQWYIKNGYVTAKGGQIDTGVAIGDYEADYWRKNPDGVWHTPEKPYKGSHHPTKGQLGYDDELKYKAEYRRKLKEKQHPMSK